MVALDKRLYNQDVHREAFLTGSKNSKISQSREGGTEVNSFIEVFILDGIDRERHRR